MLRNPTTLPSSDILIEDPVLDPYFITNSVSSGGYTVYERVTRGDKDTDYLRTVCYPSTFNFALKVIAKEKLSRGANTHYRSIKEYVETWETITKSIENATLIEL
jgi:hypothetical protein